MVGKTNPSAAQNRKKSTVTTASKRNISRPLQAAAAAIIQDKFVAAQKGIGGVASLYAALGMDDKPQQKEEEEEEYGEEEEEYEDY